MQYRRRRFNSVLWLVLLRSFWSRGSAAVPLPVPGPANNRDKDPGRVGAGAAAGGAAAVHDNEREHLSLPPPPPNTHNTGIISIRRFARLPNTHPHQIETVLITLGPSSCNHLEVGFSGPGQGQRPSISKDGPAGGAGGRAVDQTRATLFGGEDGPGKACYEQILAGEPVKQISADEWDLQQTLDKVMAGPGSVVTQEQYEENGIPYSNNRAQAKFPILRDGKLPPDMLWTDGRHRIMVVNSMSILVDSTRAAANSLDGGAEALDEMMRQLQGRTGTAMATLYGPDSEWTARAGQALMRAFATAMG